jgi:hypothetical protein
MLYHRHGNEQTGRDRELLKKRILRHLICDREQVIIPRHVGHHTGREALAAFKTIMSAHPRAADYGQLIDTRKWFGSIYDQELAELAAWMQQLRLTNGLSATLPRLAYLSRRGSGAEAIAPQVQQISGQQTAPFYDLASAWHFLAPGHKMTWRVRSFYLIT